MNQIRSGIHPFSGFASLFTKKKKFPNIVNAACRPLVALSYVILELGRPQVDSSLPSSAYFHQLKIRCVFLIVVSFCTAIF